MTILYILIFILVLAIVVCFHEFGHYIFAKKAGILVNEFAFGMGPKLLTKKKGETYWSIRALPIGGFCAMSGEEQTDSVIKEGDEIRIQLENDTITKIIVNKDIPEYQNYQSIVVEKLDLLGANMSPLYINEYEVKRDAIVVLSKNDEVQVAPEERNYFSKTVLQRFLVCFGGPLNNILLALFVFLILGFISGVPNGKSNELGDVSKGSPAELAGLQKGDRITKIGEYDITEFNQIHNAIYSTNSRKFEITYIRNGETNTTSVIAQYFFQDFGFSSLDNDESDKVIIATRGDSALGGQTSSKAYKDGGLENGDEIISITYNGKEYQINSWDELLKLSLKTIDGGTIYIKYKRNGEPGNTSYEVYSDELLLSQGYESAYKQIGISSTTTFNFFGCFLNGLKYLWNSAMIIFSTLGLLLFSKEVGLKDMGSFLTILDQTASYASAGFTSLLYWVGLLSINLGIVNLLPIPALDGGRILFLIIEKITGKKVNSKVETILINVAFWLLLALIAYITLNDVIRMVGKFKVISMFL